MTPNDVQRFDEPTQHSAQRVENACDRLTYSQRWTQGWTQSRTRLTRIFANRPRRDVVRATHQDERSDMHTGLTNATSAPAIGAEGLLREPVRARDRGYPPISSAATGARWGKNSRVDPGTGVARTRLSSEKPGPDFFFFGKSPTDSQSPGNGGWVRFRRSPLPAHSPIIW